VKSENGEKEREGEERREAGGVVSRASLSRVCPARLREEEGSCHLSCKLRELFVPIQR